MPCKGVKNFPVICFRGKDIHSQSGGVNKSFLCQIFYDGINDKCSTSNNQTQEISFFESSELIIIKI